MLVRLQLVATMHGKPLPLVHRMICRICESERCSGKMLPEGITTIHCRYVNRASRETKPATYQPASKKSQPAPSESREPIGRTTSDVDLSAKVFHMLKKQQPLSLQYATPLHQMLRHLISAKPLHLLLNTSKNVFSAHLAKLSIH